MIRRSSVPSRARLPYCSGHGRLGLSRSAIHAAQHGPQSGPGDRHRAVAGARHRRQHRDLQPDSRRDDEEPAGAGSRAARAPALVRRELAARIESKRQRRPEQSRLQERQPVAGVSVLPGGPPRDGSLRRGLRVRAARQRAPERHARRRRQRRARGRRDGLGRVLPRPRRLAGARPPDHDRRRARRSAGRGDQPRLLDAAVRRRARRGRPGHHRQPRALHHRRGHAGRVLRRAARTIARRLRADAQHDGAGAVGVPPGRHAVAARGPRLLVDARDGAAEAGGRRARGAREGGRHLPAVRARGAAGGRSQEPAAHRVRGGRRRPRSAAGHLPRAALPDDGDGRTGAADRVRERRRAAAVARDVAAA